MGGAAKAVGNVVGGAANAVGSAVSPVTSVVNQIPVVGPIAGPVVGGITGGPLGAATSIAGNLLQGNYGNSSGSSPSIGSSGLPQYNPGQVQTPMPTLPTTPTTSMSNSNLFNPLQPFGIVNPNAPSYQQFMDRERAFMQQLPAPLNRIVPKPIVPAGIAALQQRLGRR